MSVAVREAAEHQQMLLQYVEKWAAFEARGDEMGFVELGLRWGLKAGERLSEAGGGGLGEDVGLVKMSGCEDGGDGMRGRLAGEW